MAWRGTRPSAFARTVERDLSTRQKQIAAYALNQLVLGSPVDSGAYRGNHRVTVNGRTFDFDPGRTGDPTPEAMATITGISESFAEVVIQQNAPYARRIEDGWSGQAPQGVYAIAYNSTVERFGK